MGRDRINEYSLIQSQTLRILHFLARIFDEFFSGFRAKFQKIVTCVAFSIKFAKTNQKFAENSEFCEKNSLFFKIIHFTPYFSCFFVVSSSAALLIGRLLSYFKQLDPFRTT